MCGIAGIANLAASAAPVEAELLERMVATIHHRGPDDRGHWIDPAGRVGLTMSRLSIIDLDAGHQPLSNEDGSVWVVFNGEIYNFPELRDRLAPRHRFATHTDTEVLVHLYEEHGSDLVDHLRGMFAFAIWDTRRERLVLARDRAGQKPLYVAWNAAARRVTFGSEIKALLEDPTLGRELDLRALDAYLTYGFVPAPQSIYRDVAKLPPGCRGVLDAGGWRVERYWRLDYSHQQPMAEAEAIERFDELLTDAVRCRLLSDVPLGAFLSGGIDSGIITAVMSRLGREPVRTFTIGFDERQFSELDPARRTAELCGTQHTEQVVDCNIEAMVPVLARHFDEPFADSSAVPTWHVSHMARQHITVALSGDGGDELLAGYNRYQACRLAERYHRLPKLLRPEWLENLVRRLPTPSTYFRASGLKSAQYFLEFAQGLRRRGWQSWLTYFDEPARNGLYAGDLAATVAELRADGPDAVEQIAEEARGLDPVHMPMWIDFQTYLPGDILTKVDRMSMAVSLECRSPLLDHRLIEWLATVPVGLKLRGLKRKYLLRRLADRYFPPGTFDRRKQGFMLPLAVWFRENLGHWAEARLKENTCFGEYVRQSTVSAIFDAHRRGQDDHSYRIWSLLMLGEFLRNA